MFLQINIYYSEYENNLTIMKNNIENKTVGPQPASQQKIIFQAQHGHFTHRLLFKNSPPAISATKNHTLYYLKKT